MTYLFGAYFVIWLALFIYLFFIDRKAIRLSAEIDSLRQKGNDEKI